MADRRLPEDLIVVNRLVEQFGAVRHAEAPGPNGDPVAVDARPARGEGIGSFLKTTFGDDGQSLTIAASREARYTSLALLVLVGGLLASSSLLMPEAALWIRVLPPALGGALTAIGAVASLGGAGRCELSRKEGTARVRYAAGSVHEAPLESVVAVQVAYVRHIGGRGVTIAAAILGAIVGGLIVLLIQKARGGPGAVYQLNLAFADGRRATVGRGSLDVALSAGSRLAKFLGVPLLAHTELFL